ncbi:MAG: PAS domain S-box protein, partial [Bacteroidia bacterium]
DNYFRKYALNLSSYCHKIPDFILNYMTARRKNSTISVLDVNLFKSITESLRKGVIVVDNEDTILYINRPLTKLLGYKTGELTGKNASEVILGNKNHKLVRSKIKARKTGLSEEYEMEALTKSGKRVLLNIYGTPLYDGKGNVIGSIGYHRDITVEKKYQKELELALNQRNELIQKIREAFFSVDMVTGKQLVMADAHEEIYGYSLKEFNKNPNLWFEVIHPDDQGRVKEGMAKLAKGETTYDEHRIIRKNGEVIWVEGKVVPTLNKAGELIRLDGVVSDISKRKKAEQLLQEKISDLNAFIYKASHDLGGPLASMMGLIYLSEDKNRDPDIKQYLSLIRLSLDKMNGLLRDLVSTVSITNENLSIGKVDLRSMVEHILDSQHYTSGFESVEFRLRIRKGIQFRTDKRFVYPILSNLIINAMKYRKPLRGAYVDVSVVKYKKGIMLKVKDNGIGIPKPIQDKVFEMFYRGTSHSTGSGLGLYIVKTSVQKLSGTIHVQSIPKKGSVFSVYLPNL